MKERPILFSAPMVRAILEGRKTMTRRVVKPIKDHGGLGRNMGSPIEYECNWISETLCSGYFDFQHKSYGKTRHETIHCPYGQPGDRLWVRERINRIGSTVYSQYYADGAITFGDAWPWKHNSLPSIHCPRGLSRITLEILNVRVERLNDISEEDALAEGVISDEEYDDRAGEENLWPCPECHGYRTHQALGAGLGVIEVDCMDCNTPKKRFCNLWESINGPGSWDANPWVWVVEFKRSDNG